MQSVTISHSKACQSFVVLIGMVCIIMYIFKLKCFKQSQSEACMVKIEFRKCTLLPKGARIIGQDSRVVHAGGYK